MVACGLGHTMVLTVGGLWTCEEGDEADRLVLTQLAVEHFEGNTQIVMVEASASHSVLMESEGGVRTWGYGKFLGHNDMQRRHVPTLLPGVAFAGGKVVMVAAGRGHTVAVTTRGCFGPGATTRMGEVHSPGYPARVRTDLWHPALTEAHLKGKGLFLLKNIFCPSIL